MNREQAKALLPIIQAYSEGKTIQFLKPDSDEWRDVLRNENNEINFEDLARYEVCYRVKPEAKYRHFKNAEECWQEMQKHQPFGWIKNGSGGLLMNIITIGAGITVHNNISNCGYSFKTAFSLRFADGTPFGIKEE